MCCFRSRPRRTWISSRSRSELELVSALVEGATDEIVARRIVAHCGHDFGVCYGKHGVGYILQRLGGFAAAASYGPPLLVMVDLMDSGIACARDLVPTLLADRPALCILRGVVRELESWLLADREAIAAYLGLSLTRIPRDPEALPDPKQSSSTWPATVAGGRGGWRLCLRMV